MKRKPKFAVSRAEEAVIHLTVISRLHWPVLPKGVEAIEIRQEPLTAAEYRGRKRGKRG